MLFAGLLWGLNWPAVKILLTEIPPLTIRAAAFPLAAILMAAVARALGHRLWPERGEWTAIAGTGLLLVFGFNVFTVLGQTLTETSRAAIIAYTMPAFTALFAAPVLGERIGARTAAALALGMAGLAVLASEDIAGLAADPRGPLLMLAAAVSWALGNVALKLRVWSLPPLSLAVWFFVISTLLCAPLALVLEEPPYPAELSARVLAIFAFHVLGPMVICYTLWTTLLRRMPATVAALSILFAPVVGVAASVALLGDPLTWQKPVALALVLASIAMTLR